MEEVDAIFALGDVNGDGQIDMGKFISIGMEMVPLKRMNAAALKSSGEYYTDVEVNANFEMAVLFRQSMLVNSILLCNSEVLCAPDKIYWIF